MNWPIQLLKPKQLLWQPASVADNDRAIDGILYAGVHDGGGRWACTMTVPLNTLDQVRTALGLVTLAYSGATVFEVPVLNFGLSPYVGGLAPSGSSFGDGSTFSDGSEMTSSGINITLANDAALRATALRMILTLSAPFRGYEPFSFTHAVAGRRLYTVLLAAVQADASVIATTWPPLREATLHGALADFDRPSCLMTLVNAPSAMAALTRGNPVKSTLTLQFEEAP